MAKIKNEVVSWKKYLNIIIPVVLMLLTIVSVIVLVFFMNKSVVENTNIITLAGKQEGLVQNIKNSIYNIDLYSKQLQSLNADEQSTKYVQTMDALSEELLHLEKTKENFDSTLNIFKKGGSVALSNDENNIYIQPIKEKEILVGIDNAITIWQPYSRLIDSLNIEIENNQINPQTVAYATDYARIFNERLYLEVRDTALKVNVKIDKLNKLIQIIMASGLIIAILLVFYVIIVALRSLLRTDKQLGAARKETTQIMATVNEGLFLINQDLEVGHEYSAQLEEIIGQRKIGGRIMTDVLAEMVSEKDLKVVQTFVKQLYNDRVVEDLIQELNPLNRVYVSVDDFAGGTVNRYLDFKFSRVYIGEKIDRALVSVTDVTESVVLEEKLEREREQNDRQVEMLNTILNADGDLMNSFVDTTQKRITEINRILQVPEKTQEAMKDKVKYIYREVHSMKGEASAMGLAPFVSICEAFEEKIKQLQAKSSLSGNDFLSLAVILDELMSLTNLIEKLNNRLGGFVPKSADTGNVASKMQKYYEKFAQDIAKRNNKEVSLKYSELDDSVLTEEQQNTLKDLSVQLLRNAIVHGIEPKDARQNAGKFPAGNVQLLLLRNANSGADLIVEDDGRGLDLEMIRRKAVEKGLYTQEEAATFDNKKLISILFSSGFSTAEQSGEDAGRGVGMDIVRDRINQLNGKLKIASVPGRYTRFTINFPLSK